MLLLALDTSTRQSSIALCSEDEVYSEYSWHIGNNHSVAVLTHIQRLAAECEISLSALDAIAVATGPGSFNGVRVALATAKSLAFALRKPLIGVSTLDLIAAAQQQWHGPLCAVLEAGRSELYTGCYLCDEQRGSAGELSYSLIRLDDYQVLTPHLLAAYLQEQAATWFAVPGESQLPRDFSFLFCGELLAPSRAALSTHLQGMALFAGNVQSTRHATVLAMLALQRLQAGDQDDPLSLEPLYLRRPSITTSTRKQPLLGGIAQ